MKANNTSTGNTVSSLKNAVAPGASNRSFGAAGKGGTQPKIIMYVLCQDELYKTDGTTTYLQDIFEIELRELGPMIEQIRVHYVCESGSTNFTAKVTLMWSVLGKTWSTSADILTGQTGTNTGTISSAMTTTTQFGTFTLATATTSNFGEATITITPTDAANFGIVAWMCNSTDLRVSSLTFRF